MQKHTEIPKFDFKPIAHAIRKAREAKGISREALAEECDVSPGYIKTLENTGKNPGFQLFWQLVTKFGISVDPYFYPNREIDTNSERRSVIDRIYEIEDNDFYIVEAVVDKVDRRREAENAKKDEEKQK